MAEIAEAEELTYDPMCWLAEVEHLRDRDCAGEPFDDDECTPLCRPWHGDLVCSATTQRCEPGGLHGRPTLTPGLV